MSDLVKFMGVIGGPGVREHPGPDGTPTLEVPVMGESTCTMPGCDRPLRARGLCPMHYRRWRVHGDPNHTQRPQWGQPEDVRFWMKVDADGDCWEWTGSLVGGYGRFRFNSRHGTGAHRWAYQNLVGPIPDGLELDHLCRNRRCVNPDHLEPVTTQTNILRGTAPTAANAHKTHCPKGHPYSGDNLKVYARPGGGRPSRYCRTCAAEWSAKNNQGRRHGWD